MDPPYIFSLNRCHSPSSLQLGFVVFAFEAALTGLEFNLVGKASLELRVPPVSDRAYLSQTSYSPEAELPQV